MIWPLSHLTFTRPGMLWLLLIVPVLVIAAWRYGVKPGRMPSPAPFLRGLAAIAIIISACTSASPSFSFNPLAIAAWLTKVTDDMASARPMAPNIGR